MQSRPIEFSVYANHCPFFRDNEYEECNNHSFGCVHPKADDKQCYAAGCPLCTLADPNDSTDEFVIPID